VNAKFQTSLIHLLNWQEAVPGATLPENREGSVAYDQAAVSTNKGSLNRTFEATLFERSKLGVE